MLRVTVELVPFGNEHGRKIIGTMIIANDGTGTPELGNYVGKVSEEFRSVKEVNVKNHRRADGFWPLIVKCLSAAGWV